MQPSPSLIYLKGARQKGAQAIPARCEPPGRREHFRHMIKQDLIKSIEGKSARVGVIGLGYVGLPLLAEFARQGFESIGFEVDERKAAEINTGRSYIGDVPSSAIGELVAAGRMRATTDFKHLAACDAIIICVPTPLRKTKEPDISYIMAAAEEIKQNLRPGQLII